LLGDIKQLAMKKIHLISGLALLSFLGIGATWVISKATESSQILPEVIKNVPEFSMISHEGESFTRDSLLNKITVLDFIFTSCPGPCPIMSSNMRKLYKQYRLHHDLQFISITVDPEYDSQDVLKIYAEANGVNDARWKFLRANKEKIKELKTEGFLFMSDNLPAGHSVKFILIDADANIRQYYNGTDDASISILRNHLNLFLKKLRS
jgi:protein SCO1/2